MMTTPQPNYTLGLDIGMASVGAALLAEDHILALFVRTFDKAETAKKGESLNKIRREARLTRRRIRRRAHRLLRLRRLFKRIGLTDSQNATSFADGLLPPWQLRTEGLDRQLTPTEWAAVLYHLLKHRGFQSNRKSEAKPGTKTGEMLGGVSANQQQLSEGGYRTIGEMAWRDERFSAAKRNKGGDYSHTFARADLVTELRTLFDRQRALSNPQANPEFETAVYDLLMARRPTLSGKKLLEMVGPCTFEPGEPRAPKASHSAERFVWLTRLNNLRISGIGTTRPLTDDERQTLIRLPFTQTKLTYEQVRTKLALGDADHFVGLDYRGKDPEGAALFEAKAFHLLHKKYKKADLQQAWQRDSQDRQRLDDLAYALTVFKDDNEARQWLTEQGVEAEITEAVLEESFDKFIRLSIKALHKILPHMEAGLRYDEAVQAAGYAHHSQIYTDSKTRYIPKINKEDIANPVVSRALNQARKLVNAIVREYGPPMSVHIELARDLNKDFKERKEIQSKQEKYRQEKEQIVKQFFEHYNRPPKRDQLAKLRLCNEQLTQCAYCQNPLDPNRLIDDDGYAEVDHALPYSRSFDDGMNNKVVVHTKCNRDKGNRTPYEYFGATDDSPEWQRFVAWVSGNPNYRQEKKQRLLRKDFGKEEARKFSERNLTDTRYASRKFKELVETHLQLAEESDSQRCVVVSGQLTAYLRTRWGIPKIREDGDLHHALDAAVVAACSHGMVKRLSDYSQHHELAQARGNFIDYETGEELDLAALQRVEAHFPKPWPGFREELKARLSSNPVALLSTLEGVAPVRVSRAPTRRGLGSAHQETIRSAKCLEDGMSSVKKPLTSLSLKDLPNVVGFTDPRNRALMEAIEQRLRAHGDNGAKAFKEPLRRPAAQGKEDKAPIVRSVSVKVTLNGGVIVRGGIAKNESMIRVDIFTRDRRFYAVPLYVADTVRYNLPLVSAPGNELMDDSYSFLFSLYPNDWLKVSFKKDPPKEGYFAGLDISNGAISIWAHDRNQAVGKKGLLRSIGIKTALSLEKYHVDILGRLYRAQQETRKPLKHK